MHLSTYNPLSANMSDYIKDKLFLSPHSIETLGLRVACLSTNCFLNYIHQVHDNQPLRSTLIALCQISKALEHTHNAIDQVNTMETQLVAARAQLLSSHRKINHALHKFTDVLHQDVLGAQIPCNWYMLLYPELLCKQLLHPEPRCKKEATIVDDNTPTLV